MFGGVDGKVGALGEVLPQQAVGVFVGAALPGAGGVAEVDRDVGGDGEGLVGGHFGALVPGQGPLQVRWGGLDRGCQCCADGSGTVVGGQVDEQQVAGAAFDQGGDGGAGVAADDEVAFPVPGDGPVGCFGGPFTDHHHGVGVARLALGCVAVRAAHGAAGAQGAGQFATQFALTLDVESLVDGFVGHVHLRPVGRASAQSATDLLGAPSQGQVVLDEVAQFQVLADLAGLGAGPAGCRAGLGGVGPVLAVRGVPVAAYLPADRRRAAAQLGRDGPDSGLLPQPVGDVDAVGLAQVAREGRSRLNARRHHRVDRWCRLVPARGSAYVPPSLAGPDVDADDRGGLGVAHSLIHKPEVCLPLLDQLPGSLRPPVLPDLEVHCHPWTGVLQRPLEPGSARGHQLFRRFDRQRG